MAATLTNTIELLTDVIDAFKTRFPMITAMATDFSNEEARLGDTIRGRVMTSPTTQDYGANGYKDNAADANSLSNDVTVTLNQHKHVPIKVDYINQISTRRNLYNEVVGEMAHALGKGMVDYVLGEYDAANISNEVVATEANSDLDVLLTANKVLNTRGASPTGRYAIVNSDVFAYLQSDERVSSGDYYGQRRDGNAYGVLSNIGGFENVYEYPDLPSNDSVMTGLFADRSAIVLAARVPSDFDQVAASLGVPSIAKTEVVTDADTGLSFMNITYQDPHTFDLYTTTTVIYGAHVGGAGTADAGTDKGGLRLVNAESAEADAVHHTVVNYGGA